MRRLQMHNGKVRDAERCPECGRPLDHVDERGDATAYVHAVNTSDCIV